MFEYDGRGRVKKVQIPYTQEMEESFADQLKECGKVPERYVPRKIQLGPELKSKCVDLMEKCGLSRMRLDYDKSVWAEEYEYDARGNRIKCSAPTESEEIRKKINVNPADFLDHPNQYKKSNSPYRGNELPRSAGCTIGKDGQQHHDEYMRMLKTGVENIEDVKKLIYSYGNGGKRKCIK